MHQDPKPLLQVVLYYSYKKPNQSINCKVMPKRIIQSLRLTDFIIVSLSSIEKARSYVYHQLHRYCVYLPKLNTNKDHRLQNNNMYNVPRTRTWTNSYTLSKYASHLDPNHSISFVLLRDPVCNHVSIIISQKRFEVVCIHAIHSLPRHIYPFIMIKK